LTGIEVIAFFSDVRRFVPGSFTIANDQEEEKFKCALDVNFCILTPISTRATILLENEDSPNPKKQKKASKVASTALEADMGGSVHYIVENEEEELLALDARGNTLSLVYREGVEVDEMSDAEETSAGIEDSDKKEAIEDGYESDNEDDEDANGVLKFVKYMNHLASHARCDVDMIYRVKASEDSQMNDAEEDEDEDS
jgi:hypothetical protein